MERVCPRVSSVLRSAFAAAVLASNLTVSAVETPPELKPILARMDVQLAEAERALHQAQAKAREDTIKEFEKLLKVERKRKGSTLAIELESRILILTNEANHLRDEPLLKAEALDEKIRTKTLTEDDWEAIPVAPLEVSAKEARTSTKVKLAQGDLYLIVPHPGDTWQASASYPKVTFLGGQDRFMRLLVMVGEKELATWLVAEPGVLTLGPKDDRTNDNVGAIRVKIIRVH
jgi:hypothetical protein